MEELKCKYCLDEIPLYDENGKRRDGNRHYHKRCAYLMKLKRNQQNYEKIKQPIHELRKTDEVLAKLYKLQEEKVEISEYLALSLGLKRNVIAKLKRLKSNNQKVGLLIDYAFQVVTIEDSENKTKGILIKIYKKDECY